MIAMRLRIATAFSGLSEMPATTAEPADGAISVPSVRTVVVLPAPFGPRKPNTSPQPTLNETSPKAVRSPKRLVNPSTVIASSPSASRRSGTVDAPARNRAIAATCSGERSAGSRAIAGASSSIASAMSWRSPDRRQSTAEYTTSKTSAITIRAVEACTTAATTTAAATSTPAITHPCQARGR